LFERDDIDLRMSVAESGVANCPFTWTAEGLDGAKPVHVPTGISTCTFTE
jgi:hypothetical protein